MKSANFNGWSRPLGYSEASVKTASHSVLGLLMLAAGTASAAITAFPFERYQVILDRNPFGSPPPMEAAAPPPVDPAQSFARNLRLTTIVELDDGSIKVGFVDNRNGKSYLLAAGESENNIEVVSATWKDDEAVLKSGAEMVVVKLSSSEVRDVSAPRTIQAAPAPSARATYEERRRARAAPPPPEPPPQPKYTGEELTRHLQEYQLEVIRQGLPPLPLPLTPEMDAKLVSEGILPPR